MLVLVADKVYLLVLKNTINTALQCYCFIHCLECNYSIQGDAQTPRFLFSVSWVSYSLVTPCECIITQTTEWGNYTSNSAPGMTHNLHIEGTGSFVIRTHDLIMQWWTNGYVSCDCQLLGQMESQQCHRMHILKSLLLLKAEVQRAICFSDNYV